MGSLHFQSDRVIGHGGFSVVDQVYEQKEPINKYARKRFINRLGSKGELRQIFENEVNSMKKVSCLTHCVTIYNSYEDSMGEYPFNIVMSPVADTDLQTWLSDLHKEPALLTARIEQDFQWICCLASTLQDIHELGVRHRDLKPENILIKGSQVYLTDFGLSFEDLGKTQAGSTVNVGTARYRPPESLRDLNMTEQGGKGQRTGILGDVFSLGGVYLDILNAFCEAYEVYLPLGFPRSFGTFAAVSRTYGFYHQMENWKIPIAESDMPEKCRLLIQSLIRYILSNMLQLDPDRRHDACEVASSMRYHIKRSGFGSKDACSLGADQLIEAKNWNPLTPEQVKRIKQIARMALAANRDIAMGMKRINLQKADQRKVKTAHFEITEPALTFSDGTLYAGDTHNFLDKGLRWNYLKLWARDAGFGPVFRDMMITGTRFSIYLDTLASHIYDEVATMDIPRLVRQAEKEEGSSILAKDFAFDQYADRMVSLVMFYQVWVIGRRHFASWSESLPWMVASDPQNHIEWDDAGPTLIAHLIFDHKRWAATFALEEEQ